jgi:amino acid permease
MSKKFFYAVAILIGTIVGAGIFGIPYVVARFGFFPGIFYLFFLGAILLIVNLCYGEVALRTKNSHYLAGYAELYLGKKWKYFVFFSGVLGLYGALTAYLIIVGDFLNTIFSPIFSGNPFVYSIIFFFICSLAILAGLHTIGKIELLMSFFLLTTIITISFFGFSKIDIQNFFTFDASQLFIPFGVILFALSGELVIPSMEDLLEKENHLLKKAIICGTITTILLYFLFVLMAVGVAGQNITENAILGLGNFLGPNILFLGTIFGILSITTSFLNVGLTLKRIYIFDFGLNKLLSWALALFLPFFIFLSKATSFIQIIGISGALSLGCSGIIIILCYLKAKKTGEENPAYFLNIPKPLLYFIITIFGLGIIYQIISLLV